MTAVVFDIGGVLGHTPPTGWQERWAARTLGMAAIRFADTRQAIADLDRVLDRT